MNVFGKPTTRLHRLVLFFSLVACLLPSTPAVADSQSWRLLENNNRLLGEQGGGGDAEEAGTVRITYYGHMAFKMTSPQGLEVLVDPWRNDPSGAWGLWFPKPFPEIAVDIVLSTHAHFDHDAVYRPHAISVLERLAGRYEVGDLRVLGLADKHVCHAPGWYKWDLAADEVDQDFCPPDNPLHMDNFIQVIETGGLRIAHWGDNRPQPAPYADGELQGVDVLILPIDESAHLLSEADIGDIIARYRPRIVIPAHYRMRDTSSVLSTLGTADSWVASQDEVRRLDGPVLELHPDEVADLEGQVVYFGTHAARD